MTKKDVYWVATDFEITSRRRSEIASSYVICSVDLDNGDTVGDFLDEHPSYMEFSLLSNPRDPNTEQLEKLLRETVPQREGGILPCIEVNPDYSTAWTGRDLSVNLSGVGYVRFAEYLLLKDPEDKRWVHACIGNSFKHFNLVVQTGKASRELGDLKEGLRRDPRINLQYLEIKK